VEKKASSENLPLLAALQISASYAHNLALSFLNGIKLQKIYLLHFLI
jgi:hypothetical protein